MHRSRRTRPRPKASRRTSPWPRPASNRPRRSSCSARRSCRDIEIDLARTDIRSPVEGVVVKRDIELGQTVAASLSAPTLFTIAQDLREIDIYANIDEADVGRLKDGQRVGFTVNAYPNRSFEGSVRMVRLCAQTVQNVVTYTAVIGVEKPGSGAPPRHDGKPSDRHRRARGRAAHPQRGASLPTCRRHGVERDAERSFAQAAPAQPGCAGRPERGHERTHLPGRAGRQSAGRACAARRDGRQPTRKSSAAMCRKARPSSSALRAPMAARMRALRSGTRRPRPPRMF